MYFTELVKDHHHLKQTIAQIEATKKKIRENEKQNIPLPEIQLRQPYSFEDATYNPRNTFDKEKDVGVKLIAFINGLEVGEIKGETMLSQWNDIVVEMDQSSFTNKEMTALGKISEIVEEIASRNDRAKAVEISIMKQNIKRVLIPALIQDQQLVTSTISQLSSLPRQPTSQSDVEFADTREPEEPIEEIDESTLQNTREEMSQERDDEPLDFDDPPAKSGSASQQIQEVLRNDNIRNSTKKEIIRESLEEIDKTLRNNNTQRINLGNTRNVATLFVLNDIFDFGFKFFSPSADQNMNENITKAIEAISVNKGGLAHAQYIINIFNLSRDQELTQPEIIGILRSINSPVSRGTRSGQGLKQIGLPKTTKCMYSSEFLSKRADDIFASIKLGNRSRQTLNELDDILQVLVNRKEISSSERGQVLNQLHGFVSKKKK
jgi:hypothetical protein